MACYHMHMYMGLCIALRLLMRPRLVHEMLSKQWASHSSACTVSTYADFRVICSSTPTCFSTNQQIKGNRNLLSLPWRPVLLRVPHQHLAEVLPHAETATQSLLKGHTYVQDSDWTYKN